MSITYVMLASNQRERVQTKLTKDFEIIAAYLAVKSLPA
jgi:hypothetical protein